MDVKFKVYNRGLTALFTVETRIAKDTLDPP